MKIYYDTEFIEDGRTIDLISIGMVAEDGREYYAVNYDPAVILAAVRHPWLRANVISSLPVQRSSIHPDCWEWDLDHPDWPAVKTPGRIANEVRDFILAKPDPQLWADYCAYDHVVLCQLWGSMINLPEGIPMWTHDLRQEIERHGSLQMPEQKSDEHNALADARHVRVMAECLAP